MLGERSYRRLSSVTPPAAATASGMTPADKIEPALKIIEKRDT
jgi:hypothetical protein